MRVLLVSLWAWWVLASSASAALSPCTETTEVVGTASTLTTTVLSNRPARLCGAHLVATMNNGWCQVFDSPDSTDPTHGQSRTIAEPGSGDNGWGDHAWFGDNGYPTRYGLGVRVSGGRCIVHYGTAP